MSTNHKYISAESSLTMSMPFTYVMRHKSTKLITNENKVQLISIRGLKNSLSIDRIKVQIFLFKPNTPISNII